MKTLALILTLFVLSPAVNPQDGCEYDERCGTGMCLVWENGRQVCTPKQYRVAIWDGDCILKVERTPETRFEAPLNWEGKPKLAEGFLASPKVTIKDGCQARIETRNH
jgi:hypothetical protein